MGGGTEIDTRVCVCVCERVQMRVGVCVPLINRHVSNVDQVFKVQVTIFQVDGRGIISSLGEYLCVCVCVRGLDCLCGCLCVLV